MITRLVADPDIYLRELGSLHDARILTFSFHRDEDTFEMRVDNLRAAFWNDYDDPVVPAFLEFHKLGQVILDLEIVTRELQIADCSIVKMPGGYRLHTDLSAGGGERTKGAASIAFDFSTMRIHP